VLVHVVIQKENKMWKSRQNITDALFYDLLSEGSFLDGAQRQGYG
jgi:hypothetical protein